MFVKEYLKILQAEARRGAGPGGNNSSAFRKTQESRDRTGCNMSYMLENQVCRWCRPHLQLLQHPVLRTLRWKGLSTVEQGRKLRETYSQ